MFTTDEGRARFWAESAREEAGIVAFRFPNGQVHRGKILQARDPERFAIEYFGGSVATFDLEPDGLEGTVLTLTETGVRGEWRSENLAGWVSVLMALKAAVDFSVDLRNHDSQRCWDQGFVEN